MTADVRWSFFTRLLMGVLLLVIPLGGIACGGDDGDDGGTSVALSSITVSPATATVALGGTQQFTVTGTWSDKKARAVTGITWTSSSTSVATVSEDGLATAVAEGTTTITATAKGKSATATMIVNPEKTLTAIQVTPATASIGIGTTQSFMATAMYSDSSSEDVTSSATWASSDTAVATIAAGVATAVADGSTTITATYDGETGSAVLTVTPAAATSLTVAPATATFAAGDTEQFTATIGYDDGTSQVVTTQATWSSDDDAIATVSASGLATGVSAGDTTISAAFLGLTGTADVTITDAYVTEVVVAPASAVAIVGGGEVQFTATAIYNDSTSSDVTDTATWTSDDDAIATVDAAGAATAVAEGTTTITAEFDGVSGTASLTVPANVVLQSIAVTPATASIAAGSTQQFIATATYSDNSTANVTSSVTWTTSAPATATISALGMATGVAAGTTTVTAAIGTVQGTATLTVTTATLVSIDVTPATASVAVGATQQYAATGVYSDSSTQDLTATATWASSNVATATIDAAGLATGASSGTTNITAVSGGITSNTAVLVVSGVTLTAVNVTCTPTSIAAGVTSQCTATATYSDGSTQNVTSAATWTTSASGVATVSQLGQVSGIAAGTADITAAYQGQSDFETITVTAATLQTIQITPAAPSIALGNTQQFAAAGLYSDNSTQDITAQVTWTSATTTVATISNAAGTEGLATSAAVGTTNVTAALGGVTSNTAVLTVTNAALTSIEVLPANPTTPAGFTQQFTARGRYSDNTTADLTNDPTLSFASATASVATISNAAGTKGLASALAGGTSVITATRGALSGNTTLTVSTATLSSIAVTPNTQTAQVGTTVQYTATGTFSDNSTMDLTTQSTWAPTTGGVTVAASGLATIAATATPGSFNITATRGAVQGNATLTVVQPLTLTQIRIYWLFANQFPAFQYMVLPIGQSRQLFAVGTYTDGITTVDQDITDAVTWASSSTEASISNSAPRGLTTINACTTPGLCTFTMTASLSGLTGTRLVYTPNPLDCVEDEIVIYHPVTFGWSAANTATMFKGQSQQWGLAAYFTARPGRSCPMGGFEYDLTGNPDVSWASDALGVASVSFDGVVTTANNPASPYTSNISAQYTNGEGTVYNDSTLLTVSNACVDTLSISPVDPTIPIGLELPLSVTATLSDGSQQVYDYTNLTNQLTFTKDPTTAAAFNLNQTTGVVSALATGTADVTVTLNTLPECDVNNPPEATTTISVNDATITGVTVAPATLTATIGAETQLTANGTYSDGSTHNVTLIAIWGSSAPTVADFLSATPGLLTAQTQGNAVITATVGTFSGSSAVTVSGCTLNGVTVTPGPFTCGGVPGGAPYPVGVNIPLVATGSYVGGAAAGCPDADITNQVTWSSDLGTISVASNGYARTNGSTGGVYATVTATMGTFSDTIDLAAETQTLGNTLTVAPSNFSIPNAGVAQFTASGSFASGACDLLGNVVTWGAAPSTLLTIDSTGSATGAATGSGNATVTATYAPNNAITGTVAGTVGGDCIESLYLNPASANLQVGGSVNFDARANLGSGTTTGVNDNLVTWTIESQAPQGTIHTTSGGNFYADAVGTAVIKGTWMSPTCSSPGTPVMLEVTAPITVSAATLESVLIECVYAGSNIQISGTDQVIPVNVRGRCRAIGTASDGSTLGDISEDLDWTASGQASVSNVAGTKGAITGGVAAGSAIIRVEQTGSSPLIFDEQILQILPNTGLTLAVQPDPNTLPVGYGEQYSATGTYAGLVFDVTNAVGAQWRCCTGTTATCTAATNCSVSGTGYITPTSGSPATVHPRIDLDGHRFIADLSISTQALSGITVNRLGTPEGTAANMVLGEQVQFQADGYFGTGGSMIGPFDITEDVNWSVSTAGYITVDNSAGTKGLANATMVTPGATTVDIIANNTTPAVQGTYAGLTVVDKCVDGITLNANTTSAPSGLGVRFTVTASYSDGSSGNVTQQVTAWGSDNGAAFANPTNCGGAATGLPCVFYAGTPGQTSLISASIAGCGGATFADSLLASVNTATLASVDVAPESTDLPKGQKTQFMATANYSDATSFDVTADPVYTTWTTADPTVAAIVVGDPPGTVLASTTNFGSTSVIATYHGVSDFGTVNVVDEVLNTITVYALNTIPSASDCPNFDDLGDWNAAPWISTGFQLPAGSYKSRVRAIGTYSDGSLRDITANVTWTSSVAGVATVVDGLVETGTTAGASTITATQGTVSDTLTLNTSAAALSAVNVVPNGGFTRPIGVATRFHVIGTFGTTSFCVDESATWTSANTAVATVSNVAEQRGWTTGVALGGTNITATVGTYSDTEPFGVTSAVLQYIAVMPATVTISFTETAQLVAMGHYSDGTDVDITTSGTTNWFATPGLYGAVNNTTNKGLFTAGSTAGVETVDACVGAMCASTGTLDRSAEVTVTP
jgi:uncharacterized protein YjdB